MNDNYQAVYDAIRSRFQGDFIEAFRQAVHFDVSNDVYIVGQEFCAAAGAMMRPHVLMKPRIFPDGNRWCALYGENLQDGVAGFGRSPAEATADFDISWHQRLPAVLPTPVKDERREEARNADL